MSFLLIVILCITFVELVLLLNLRQLMIDTLALSKEAVSVLTSTTLTDDEKETQVRQSSLNMFKLTFFFIVKFLGIVIVLYGIFFIFAKLSLIDESTFMSLVLSPAALIAMTIGSMIYVWGRYVIIK
jgi:zona occludens toxin (predicted ATPase)